MTERVAPARRHAEGTGTREGASDAAIAVRGLGRDFGGRPAVVALDLAVARGEVLALLGHNGAGKTTTVRLLNGVLHPDRGGGTVLGLDPWRDGRALAPAAGVLVLDARLLLVLGAVVWLLDAVLLVLGLRGFTRARLLGGD